MRKCGQEVATYCCAPFNYWLQFGYHKWSVTGDGDADAVVAVMFLLVLLLLDCRTFVKTMSLWLNGGMFRNLSSCKFGMKYDAVLFFCLGGKYEIRRICLNSLLIHICYVKFLNFLLKYWYRTILHDTLWICLKFTITFIWGNKRSRIS